MKNVLVFPCGSEIGLEINKSVKYSTHFKLYGGSSIDDHGKYAYDNYVADIPFIDDPNFIVALNLILEKYEIDFIIPAHDDVLLRLAEESAAHNLKCPVITSPLKTCQVTRSKLETYELFKGVVPTPEIFALDQVQESNLPLFLKPDVGQGSKGTHLAKSLEDVYFYSSGKTDLLILEYLPGREYTVDCFTNKDGKLLFAEGRQRERVSNGISVASSTVNNPVFEELANKINDTLQFRGVWFFQIKEDAAGKLVLLEIAPRVAGTMGLVRCKGINLVLMSLFDAMGYEVKVTENTYEMAIDRALHNSYRHDVAYEHVYLDFDDTVILNDSINTAVIGFVYQCINNGVKVHLITRHKNDIHETLKKHRLSGVFDEVIWIKDGDKKYPYIKEAQSIFIDDSFAEREEISGYCKIPVFDTHMLESLIK